MTATGVHDAARDGYSAGASTYARGRPDYPAALLEWLVDAVGAGPGRRVVDLGAGTGKFTRQLVRSEAEVFAVEPVAAMRAEFAVNLPAVPIRPGTAESIPLETASVEAVVCAQAFHWFATTAALNEIHRVLRPSGRLALVWNVRDESVDWVAAITRIVNPYEGDAPRFYKGDWRKPFGDAPFSALQETVFAHAHTGSAQEVIIDRFLSVSFIAALPAADKAKVEAELRRLVVSHPALRDRASITFPYRTSAFVCSRLP